MIVLFYGSVLEFTGGKKSYEPKNSPNVHMLIDELGCHFGMNFKDFLTSGENCFFLVNSRSIATTGGLATKLHPGDKIEVLPLIEAG